MTKTIDQFIKKIKKKGKLLSFQEHDKQKGVKKNRSSCYLEREKLLIRGEFDNGNTNRKAVLTVFNMKTKTMQGKLKLYMIYTEFSWDL